MRISDWRSGVCSSDLVVVFGHGGTAVELVDDKSLALPPLDLRLAHEMIGRTRVSRVLKAYREVPAADERALALVLVKLAQMARSEEHTSELQSLMRNSYAVFCLKKKNMTITLDKS